MKDIVIDITSLKDLDSEFANTVNEISASYRCEWDDAVHESYRKYIKDMQELSQRIKTLLYKGNFLQEEIEDMHIVEVKSKSRSLCDAVDEI